MTSPHLGPGVLMAHRGWPGRYPENSVAGIAGALEAGARRVEVDVQLTRDGVPVVIHDAELARTANRSGRILDLLAAALPGIDVGEVGRFGPRRGATPLPTLAQILAVVDDYAGASAFVELKAESARHFGCDAVVDAVRRVMGPDSGHVLIGADSRLVARARAAAGTRIGWIAPALDAGAERLARDLAPEYVFVSDRVVPAAGEPFWAGPWSWVVYDVPTRKRARELLAQGATIIETDDIGDWLAAV